MEAFIARVYQVGDILGKLRDKLNRFDEDPKSLTKIELLHSESMHELINLEEVLLHLQDSTDTSGKSTNRRGSVLNLNSTAPARTAAAGAGAGGAGGHEGGGGPGALEAFTSPGFRRGGGRGADGPDGMASAVAAAAAMYNSRTRAATVNRRPARGAAPAPAAPASASDSDSDGGPSGAEVDLTDQIVRFLNLKNMIQDVTARIRDLSIALQASRHELESLRQMTQFIQSQQSYSLMQALIVNTKNMEDVFRSNERSSNSLEIMQIILAGSLAFDILDRLSTWCAARGAAARGRPSRPGPD